MSWPALLAASVTPVDSAADSVTGYLLSYGPLGIFALAMAYLLFRGWRLTSPSDVEKLRATAREEGRADLLKEAASSDARAERAEGQRDDALKIAQTQIVPLLVEFRATMSALIPLLQDLVSRRESHDRETRRR